jgi:hypothetical protein
MLSDFDLAKQSGEPGGRPATIHQEENGVRDGISGLRSPPLTLTIPRLSDTTNRYSVMHR